MFEKLFHAGLTHYVDPENADSGTNHACLQVEGSLNYRGL